MHNSENKQKLGLFIFFNYYFLFIYFYLFLGFVTQFGETTEATFLFNIFPLFCLVLKITTLVCKYTGFPVTPRMSRR